MPKAKVALITGLTRQDGAYLADALAGEMKRLRQEARMQYLAGIR
jgi:GDP-D-mannose dehydratase